VRLDYRFKLLLFVTCALVVAFGSYVGYSALSTLNILDNVEADRDHWQRPGDVIEALNLKYGNTVVDLGCGSGYFTLRLSSPVGKHGRVIGEDIQRLPLLFLRTRAWMKGKHNVSVLMGDTDDPHLPAEGVNSVLISNTYHEFQDARGILSHVSRALVPGGRLVIVDRAPPSSTDAKGEAGDHEIASQKVVSDLQSATFEVLHRDDRFIESDPQHESWWLIVARKGNETKAPSSTEVRP
jgi:ubiquinone/menaquinone biosynthesis C-methylase UbiE